MDENELVYKIFDSVHNKELSEQVSEFLRTHSDWMLYGDLKVVYSPFEEYIFFFQAVVKAGWEGVSHETKN